MKYIIALALTLATSQIANANFENWINKQFKSSVIKMDNNISRSDTLKGTVVASPSKSDPNYYYHWTRDAGLVMNVVLSLAVEKSTPLTKKFLGHLGDFSQITYKHQNQRSFGGLGEPKFYIDGRAYDGPWGRPQNDGPAIRALTLMNWAEVLAKAGKMSEVRKLYDSKQPSNSPIKKDLEYVSHNWRDTDFDLWEEIKGHHFFSRLLQYRALRRGGSLAAKLGDKGAATWYNNQAGQVKKELNYHWNGKYIRATIRRDGGIDYKSGLDSSVILASLYAVSNSDPLYPVDHPHIIATAEYIIDTFKSIYHINQRFADIAPAIGRYPEDRYDGHKTGAEGNPWFLLTSGMAEYFYKLARTLKQKGYIEINRYTERFYKKLYSGITSENKILSKEKEFEVILTALAKMGDSFLKRVAFHMNSSSSSMSEQMNRHSGYMQGARDLTWSHSNFIRAVQERSRLKRTLGR